MTRTNAELPLLKRVGYLHSSLRYSSEPLNLNSVDVQANPNTVRLYLDVRTLNVRSCLNSAYHRV